MLMTSSNSTASVHNDCSNTIPLEDLQPNRPESSPNKTEDLIPLDLSTLTMTRHKRGVDDWILSTFGNSHPFHEQVSDMLSIVSMGRRYIQCQAFVHEDTVYMTLPAVHGSRPIWAQNEFYTCMTCLIELAEEKTSCSSLVVVVDPKTKNNLQLNVVLRALMYIGFQLIDSRLYNQNPNYVLAGYEL